MGITHYAIKIDNKSETETFVQSLLKGTYAYGLFELSKKRGAVVSSSEVDKYIAKEERHGTKKLTPDTGQSLLTMSSGERKIALLIYVLEEKPDYLILVNPYDNLDSFYQKELKERLLEFSKKVHLIQIVSRTEDILPIEAAYAKLIKRQLVSYKDKNNFLTAGNIQEIPFSRVKLPSPLHQNSNLENELVRFKDVSVSFYGKTVLNSITWVIKSGEFWQLKGPNGSGKSTLLNMIIGDSHKGYGQELYLFGNKKGSGESVWDIKKNIGYFTPAMIDKFSGSHSLEHMLISGIHDSVGLYVIPTEIDKKISADWLHLLGMDYKKEHYFHQLSTSEKRLLMTARAHD